MKSMLMAGMNAPCAICSRVFWRNPTKFLFWAWALCFLVWFAFVHVPFLFIPFFAGELHLHLSFLVLASFYFEQSYREDGRFLVVIAWVYILIISLWIVLDHGFLGAIFTLYSLWLAFSFLAFLVDVSENNRFITFWYLKRKPLEEKLLKEFFDWVASRNSVLNWQTFDAEINRFKRYRFFKFT